MRNQEIERGRDRTTLNQILFCFIVNFEQSADISGSIIQIGASSH